jgi:hypothetical protein
MDRHYISLNHAMSVLDNIPQVPVKPERELMHAVLRNMVFDFNGAEFTFSVYETKGDVYIGISDLGRALGWTVRVNAGVEIFTNVH